MDSHEITLYEYDGRNLVTKEINALGDSTVYVYDGNGNLVSKTDADGYVTRYSYTALDLVKKINYNGAKEVSYQYNKVGELVQMDDWTGTNTFELDLLGRLQKMTDHKGNTVSYTYDAVGNQTGITYPDGSKTRSFYDAVYNLTSVIDADDGTYAYVYDDANRPVKLTYPNGWIEQYTYDAEGNLLKTVDTDPFQLYNKTPKVKYEYTYDAEGNVLTEFQRDSDATENLKSRTAFTYDALNRLTGSTRRLEVYPYDTLAYSYTYDTLGNLLKQSGPTKGEEDTYQYNDLNQMVSKHVCGYEQKLTRIYDYGYTYDKRGNLVKEEEICSPTTTGPKNITVATYLYDETNRMVQGTNKVGEVSAYTFNGLGVRVGTELILKDNTHGYTDFHCQTPSVETGIEKPEVVKTDYVIDYTRLNIDQRVLVKSEQDGYDFFYTYGLDKLQVMTIGEGSNWWGQSIKKCVNMAYVHTDRLGSVVNLSDQYGRVTARADYTDWGEVRRYTDITVEGGFRRLLPEITYATHEYDDVLNQFYAKARMYDAENKRFDAVDPLLDASWYEIKPYAVHSAQLTQYLYVTNNPGFYVDLLGLYFVYKEVDEQGQTFYRFVKQNGFDAVLQGVTGASIQQIAGQTVAGSSLPSDRDMLTMELKTLYANEIEQFKMSLANAGPYGAAAALVWDIVEKGITIFVDIPNAVSVSSRDGTIETILNNSNISKTSCSSKFIPALDTLDQFVQENSWMFTKYTSLGKRTVYDVGRAIISGDEKTIKKAKQAYASYFSPAIEASVLAEVSGLSANYWIDYFHRNGCFPVMEYSRTYKTVPSINNNRFYPIAPLPEIKTTRMRTNELVDAMVKKQFGLIKTVYVEFDKAVLELFS